MDIVELLNKAVEELKEKGKIIDGFVDEKSDFNDISLFFERIKEYSNLLSNNLRNELYSSYIDYVNKVQGKVKTVYSDDGDLFTEKMGINTDDFISIRKKYKLEQDNKYANKRTNKLSKVAIAAAIVVVTAIVTVAGSKILAHYVNEPVKSTPTTTIVQTTNEQLETGKTFDQVTNDQKEYINMKYKTILGDYSENEIGEHLKIPSDKIKINSDYNGKAGEVIELKINVTDENIKEIVENYMYYNEPLTKEEKQKLDTYSFYVAPGQDIKEVCREAMENYPFLKEIYGGDPTKLSNEVMDQNKNLANNFYDYQSGTYTFDLAESKSAEITHDMLDRNGISLDSVTK